MVARALKVLNRARKAGKAAREDAGMARQIRREDRADLRRSKKADKAHSRQYDKAERATQPSMVDKVKMGKEGRWKKKVDDAKDLLKRDKQIIRDWKTPGGVFAPREIAAAEKVIAADKQRKRIAKLRKIKKSGGKLSKRQAADLRKADLPKRVVGAAATGAVVYKASQTSKGRELVGAIQERRNG